MRFQHIFLYSLLVTLSLGGCGTLTETPEPVPPTQAPISIPPTATAVPTRDSQPVIVTLKLWLPEELNPYGQEPGASTLAKQLSDFSRAYPDLHVDVDVKRAHGRGGLLDFLRTARAAAPGVLPDLVVLDAADLQTAASAGLIQPLDDFLPSALADDRFPFAAVMGDMGSQTIGVVIAADIEHLAYRSDLLDAPPLSWTRVLTPPVPFLFPAQGRDHLINDATLIQYLAAGGKLVGTDGKPQLDTDALVEVLDFYSDCANTGTISPTLVLGIADDGQAWERFRSGIGVVTSVRARRYWLEADETLSATWLPTRDAQPFSIARGWALAMVTDDPARQTLTTLLLDWITAPDLNALWTQSAGYLPGTRSALQLWDISDADRATLRRLMGAAVPAPPPDVLATVGKEMQEALVMVLRGRLTPERAVAVAVERLTR